MRRPRCKRWCVSGTGGAGEDRVPTAGAAAIVGVHRRTAVAVPEADVGARRRVERCAANVLSQDARRRSLVLDVRTRDRTHARRRALDRCVAAANSGSTWLRAACRAARMDRARGVEPTMMFAFRCWWHARRWARVALDVEPSAYAVPVAAPECSDVYTHSEVLALRSNPGDGSTLVIVQRSGVPRRGDVPTAAATRVVPDDAHGGPERFDDG